MEKQVVHTFNRNDKEFVQISISEWRGSKYVDIRIFFEDERGGIVPTKKGITIKSALVAELIDGLTKCLEESEDSNGNNG